MNKPKSQKLEFRHSIAVLVEGADTLHFIRNRIADDDRFQNIKLYDFIGNSFGSLSTASGPNATLKRFLQSFMQADHAAVKAVAIIRDAEQDAVAMWQSLTEAFKRNAIMLPNSQNDIAMCSTSGLYAGGLLLPFNKTSGCLEHAMLDGKSENLDKKKEECIQSFVNCITNLSNSQKPSSNYEAKLKIHATILGHSQRTDEVARTLGETACGNFWDWEQPSLKVILDFLENLEKKVSSLGEGA